LRIAFNGFGGTAPMFLGQDVGIFKKHNLNVEMIFIAGGSMGLERAACLSNEFLLKFQF
jgi:hypothetical protein